MTDDTLYQLTNVAKTFTRGADEVTVFENLDMTIARGAFVSIMGPSGSGKTTLLNLLGGIDRPTAGEILFEGDRIDNLSENAFAAWRAANMGFIFQFYNLMPGLSAAKNVELPLLLTNLSSQERKRRIETALDLVALGERTKHKPNELSGGQQQRVAIARAIVADPKVLLCDEPTGDLDRETADEILKILKLLNEEMGKTIIMVTHDPQAAKAANREIHLDKGQFVGSELVA